MNDRAKAVAGRLRVRAAGVGAAAQEVIREAGKKTGDTIEITRLNVRVFDVGSEVNVLYRKLGELMYAAYSGEETDDARIDGLLEEIDAKKAEAASLRARISELKKERPCPVCGETCARDDRFCRRCGAEIGE